MKKILVLPYIFLLFAFAIYPKMQVYAPTISLVSYEGSQRKKKEAKENEETEFHKFMVPLSPQRPIQSLSKHQSSNGSYRILRFAILSRLLVISLICFWRYLACPYDTSASLNPSCLSVGSTIPTRSQSSRLPFLGLAIEDSIVWDGVYFVRIAECGYEYEQTYAFLPLLPICIYALSQTGKGYFCYILREEFKTLVCLTK